MRINSSTFLAAAASFASFLNVGCVEIPETTDFTTQEVYNTNEVAYLSGASSNSCIDADTSLNGAPGTNVRARPCNGNSNQRWILSDGNTIRSSAYSNQCLTANVSKGPTVTTSMRLATCYGTANQQWSWQADGTLRNVVHPGLCADVSSTSNLRSAPCTGGANQAWTIQQSTEMRSLMYTDMCLEVDPITTDVRAWDCYGEGVQRWVYNPFSGTYGSAALPGRCLAVDTSSGGSGANIRVEYCNGSANQRWQRQPSGAMGNLAHPYFCMDLGNYSGANGTDVVLNYCTGSVSQIWL